MSDLVVFYSLSGKSRQDAAWLSSAIGADVAEIIEVRPRRVGSGYLRCVIDSLLRRSPPIQPMARVAGAYDRVVLICPVWIGRLAGPARTWLAREGRTVRQLDFLLQSGSGRNVDAAAREIEEITGKRPTRIISVTEFDFGNHVAESKVRAFGATLEATASAPASG